MTNLQSVTVTAGLAVMVALALPAAAQRPEPKMEKVGDGVLLHVLPPDRIPAINQPEFVSAAAADKFMAGDEPVLGLFDGEVAKAYSLWQLDQHEIVNDRLPKMGAVAVTW
ncbi:MAG: DUF3179 domain-containing (seleno)protein [Candidatus Acidiferrales bacterium]